MDVRRTKEAVVFVIETRSFVREALCEIIEREFGCGVHGVSCVAEVHGLNQTDSVCMAIYCTSSRPRELVLSEVKALKALNSDLRIVLLTDNYTATEVAALTNTGVHGIIPSTYTSDQVSACLKAVSTGVTYFPQIVAVAGNPATDGKPPYNSKLHPEVCSKLTPRQIQIMELLTIGRSNKFIASELGLCENTVKVHVHDAMKRLGATSRTHASHLLINGLADELET